MSLPSSATRALSVVVRGAAGWFALSRLIRAARPAPPVRITHSAGPTISVVIPARNEAARIRALVDLVVGAPGVREVLVVNDRSTDSTADVAARSGARVVTGAPLPEGWAGKAWALHQGVEAAAGEWIVTLDADTRPDPRLPRSLVARAIADGLDLVTVAGRFECPTAGARWLHPAMLTTLVYRFGPPGSTCGSDHAIANGQCMAFDREHFLAAGGMRAVRGQLVEDVALARERTRLGWRVGFLDGSDLLRVQMFDSFTSTWIGWGRSLALPGVDSRRRQLIGLAIVVVAQTLPLPRLLAGRADALDMALLALRIGTLVGTRRAYPRRDVWYWLSPTADTAAAAALAVGIRRGTHQVWRGRVYR